MNKLPEVGGWSSEYQQGHPKWRRSATTAMPYWGWREEMNKRLRLEQVFSNKKGVKFTWFWSQRCLRKTGWPAAVKMVISPRMSPISALNSEAEAVPTIPELLMPLLPVKSLAGFSFIGEEMGNFNEGIWVKKNIEVGPIAGFVKVRWSLQRYRGWETGNFPRNQKWLI